MDQQTDVGAVGRAAAHALAATDVPTLPFRTKKRGFLGVEVWSEPYADGWLLDRGLAVRTTGEVFAVLLIRQPAEHFLLAMEGPLTDVRRIEEHRGARVELDLATFIPSEVERLRGGAGA